MTLREPALVVPGVAYFSMEVALASDIPTYSGGLGVLAGDVLRGAADLGLPMVGVSLLHRKGYFFQHLDAEGRQREVPVAWSPHDLLEATGGRCRVEVGGRPVAVRAWRYTVGGMSGGTVPVFLLDTDLPENDPDARALTDHLYGGDERYRLGQEVILGVGGVRMLRALGYADIARFHMNEGHAALLALELLAEELRRTRSRDEAVERVKRRCVFTTHTPVPAGHDQFPAGLAREVLGAEQVDTLRALDCCAEVLNMTLVGLQLSHYVNGVAKRHGEVSRSMFPGYPIGSITNGVHSVTWTAPPFRALYDRRIPEWRRDGFALRYALEIPPPEIHQAHEEAKRQLLRVVNTRANAGFDQHALTLGFARRATAYKRPTLLLRDLDRLRKLARVGEGIQVVFAGKAHPRDEDGKRLIREIVAAAKALEPEIKIAYLANHDLELGLLVTAGVDVWLNTPRAPYEASGTSGMKAAHNGVPSLSARDGWWLEGHIEGVTGWAIGAREPLPSSATSDEQDAADLYERLERDVARLYYGDRARWAELMRSTIAVNASYFNTQRMLHQYATYAYREVPEA